MSRWCTNPNHVKAADGTCLIGRLFVYEVPVELEMRHNPDWDRGHRPVTCIPPGQPVAIDAMQFGLCDVTGCGQVAGTMVMGRTGEEYTPGAAQAKWEERRCPDHTPREWYPLGRGTK